MSTKVIEWLFSQIISLLHTCVVMTTSGTSEVAEDQCAGHHWQLREDGCWWGFERCHCYLSDWLSDWSPQGAERSWGGGGALIVMRDRGEALKANQSHRLWVVGGAEASLEDDTSPLPCTGRAHVWHPQTIWSQTDVRISINDTHAHTHIHGGRGDANKVPPTTGRRRLWHRWNTGQRGGIGAHAHAHVFMAVIEGNTHTQACVYYMRTSVELINFPFSTLLYNLTLT